jgi:hypothetical protein
MAEPKEEKNAESYESEMPKQGVLIRGADGELYALSKEDLAPFRMDPEKARRLTEILGTAPKDFVVRKLPRNILREIQGLNRAVSTNVEVFLHD